MEIQMWEKGVRKMKVSQESNSEISDQDTAEMKPMVENLARNNEHLGKEFKDFCLWGWKESANFEKKSNETNETKIRKMT